VITPLVTDGGGSVTVTFTPNPLTPGQTSALFGYMTNVPPGLGPPSFPPRLASASIQGGGATGGTGASGTVVAAAPAATAAPEPSSLTLLGLGALGLLGYGWRKRKQAA